MQHNRTLVEELKDFCAKERERIYTRHCSELGVERLSKNIPALQTT